MAAQAQMTLKLPVETKKRGKWFIASCPSLEVVTQGETLEKAKKNLKQALKLFLISCLERGTLDEVLRQCGFAPVALLPSRPTEKSAAQAEYLNVPIPLLVKPTAESPGCHA